MLSFEGDRHDAFRLLRSVKNRYGSTNEIGVFEMGERGMEEIPDPSGMFLTGTDAPGCAVTCALEGTRPMLVEVQSLISNTPFSNPRRMSAGLELNRLILLLAVLEKKAYLSLADKDVYINVVGGMRLEERCCDLAVAMCIASALIDAPMPKNTVCLGEISLTGEVRGAGRMEKRAAECARLGYERLIIPRHAAFKAPSGIELIRVGTLAEAVKVLTQGRKD